MLRTKIQTKYNPIKCSSPHTIENSFVGGMPKSSTPVGLAESQREARKPRNGDLTASIDGDDRLFQVSASEMDDTSKKDGTKQAKPQYTSQHAHM